MADYGKKIAGENIADENYLTIRSWYRDIQRKGYSLEKIPESERTPEMCFVAIHYWGAALEFVPEKYKTYELCLDAVRHNTPVDEGCSALAFVPDELKTYELCLEAIRHDYLISLYWGAGHTVEFDYASAINFVPLKLRTSELCYEAIIHHPTSSSGYFNFISYLEDNDEILSGFVSPKPVSDILNSSDLFIQALKFIGMPDDYIVDALNYFEKLKDKGVGT
jgi:hypothetical protein